MPSVNDNKKVLLRCNGQSHKRNDSQIREVLLQFIQAEHSDCSDLVCIEEFAIYGGANRADVAALNGLSHGYEIKSDRDTLDRLPGQIEAYRAIFERATLVSTSKHLGPAKRLIPKWWGIVEVEPLNDGRSLLHRSREAKINPSLQSRAVASLLWRTEALTLLSQLGLDSGVRSKPMDVLLERLAVSVEIEQLSSHVRQILRARGDWRSAARLKQYGDSSQQPANRSSYRRTPYGNISR